MVQIAALNEQLVVAAASRPTDHLALRGLLSSRADLIGELIATNPSKIQLASLPESVVSQLDSQPLVDLVESPGEWEGSLEATVTDDFEHSRSSTQWHLRTHDGLYDVYFNGASPTRTGLTMRLRGVKSRDRIAVTGIVSTAAAA